MKLFIVSNNVHLNSPNYNHRNGDNQPFSYSTTTYNLPYLYKNKMTQENNKVKRKGIHPIAALKMGFSATRLLKIPMESQ